MSQAIRIKMSDVATMRQRRSALESGHRDQ